MPRASQTALRFVRALIARGSAVREGQSFVVANAEGRTIRLACDEIRALVATGALAGDARTCRATPDTPGWLRRQMLSPDDVGAQHRHEAKTGDGTNRNLAESPLTRLGAPATGESSAFLAPHHLAAGERLTRLCARAQMQARVTMSYSDARTAGPSGRGGMAELSDLAVDARRRINALWRELPEDCVGVLLDVCAFGKGLQDIERERSLPRRSAKLVLRIGLDHVARQWGLSPEAVGAVSGRPRLWVGENARPTIIG